MHNGKQQSLTEPISYQKPRQSLRWRLLTLLGGMLLITLLVIGTAVFSFILENEQHTWQGRQEEAARYAAETVAAFIQRTQNSLILVSLLERDVLETRPQIMGDLLQQSPALLEIIRLDTEGEVFAGAYQDAPLLANLFTIPQSRWFTESKAGRLYLSSVQISSASQPYLIISVPASDGGVVAARLRMNVLWEVVADLYFGETGQAYVVNREGQIVAHTNPKVALAKTTLQERPEMIGFLQAPNQKWSGSYINFEGTQVVGVTSPVAETPWVVITEIAEAEAFATSRTALLMLGGGMALFGLVVMLVTSRFLGRLILRPMERLRAGAVRIGHGDLHHQIDLVRQDEVGQVAEAFNEMVNRLRDREIQIAERTQALKESEERFRQVISSISDHIYMTEITADGRRINHYLSPNVETLTGYPQEKFIADWNFWPSTVIHPEDREAAAAQVARFAEGQNNEVEYRLVKADGQIIWVRDSGRVKRDAERQSLIVYGVVGDISERKRAEKKLQQQRAFLQQVIDINPHFIFAKDREGRFTLANQAFAKAYNTTVELLTGKTDAAFNLNRELVEKYHQDDLTVLDSLEELFIPEEQVIRDGQIFWRQTIKRPIISENGVATQVLGVITDITDLKRSEAALALARDQALEASRFKTQLLANVSHDLRTPLGGILGYTEMLQEGVYGQLNNEQREATKEIIDSTGQLLTFINNLLDQARIEAGKVAITLTSFAPTALVDDVHSMLGVVARAKGLELTSDIAPDIPPTLSGDPHWLRQILINLVSNAIKFTEEGRVHIYIYYLDKTHWAIAVSDTGPGISPDAQTYIFEPFRQVDGTATRGHTGSGLGLSIVKQLTVLMGGDIKVTSELGHGSTFTIRLPIMSIQEKTT